MNKGVYLPDNFTDVLDFYFQEHGGDQRNMFVSEDEQEEQVLHKEAQDTLNKQRKDSNLIMDKLNKAMNVSRQESFSTKKILNDSFYNSNRMLKMLKSGNKVDNTTFNQHAVDYLVEAIEFIKEKSKDALLDEVFVTNSKIMETKNLDSSSSNTPLEYKRNGSINQTGSLLRTPRPTLTRTESHEDKDNEIVVDHGALLKSKLDNLHMKLRQAEKPSKSRKPSFRKSVKRTFRKYSTIASFSAHHHKFEHNLANVSIHSHTSGNASFGNLTDTTDVASGTLHSEQLHNQNPNHFKSKVTRRDSDIENYNTSNTNTNNHNSNATNTITNFDNRNEHHKSKSHNRIDDNADGGKTYHYQHLYVHKDMDKSQHQEYEEQMADNAQILHPPIDASLRKPNPNIKTKTNLDKLNVIGEEEIPNQSFLLSSNVAPFTNSAITTIKENEKSESGRAEADIKMEPHEPSAPKRSSMIAGRKASIIGGLDINAIAKGTKLYGGGVKEVVKVYGSGQSLDTQIKDVCELEINEIPRLQKVVATASGEWKERNDELRSALQAVREMSSASQDGSSKIVDASENFQNELQMENRNFARKLHLKTVEKHHIKTLLAKFPELNSSSKSPRGNNRISTVFLHTQAKATKAETAKTLHNIFNCDWFVKFVFSLTNGMHQRLHPITLETARTLWLFQYLISKGVDFSHEQNESRQYLISRILEAGKDCHDIFHLDARVIGGKSARVDTDMVKLYETLHDEFGIEN